MEEEKKQETEHELEVSDNSESEDLRNLIMEQLASMETSDLSDDDGYQARLSCILEDDESESSTSQSRSKEFPKNEAAPRKMGERDKGSEESESSDNMMTLRDLEQFGDVQVTDLDEISLKNSDEDDSPSEKTEIQKTDEGSLKRKVEDTDEEEEEEEEVEEEVEEEEEEEEEERREVPFAIKKLKSSDNVLERKFVPKRTEFSSDSSDIDISISNERPGEVTAIGSGNDAVRTTPEEKSESVAAAESPMFPKVSRSYLERARSREEVAEEGDSGSRVGSVERELLQVADDLQEQKTILQVVHLRSKSPRVYTPPIPPETYLWEELKRIRGKGGYPWTYLDKPPFDEAAWKKYMEHEYEPINPPPLSVLRRREEEKEKEEEIRAARKHEPGIPASDDHVRKVRDDEPVEKKGVEVKKITATAASAVAMPAATAKAATEYSKTEEDMEVEEIAVAQELQDEIEGRYLAQTPTTTASRTDCDVNTSMLDSSGLEDIPLKRASRNKMRAQAHGIQQKLRNQAGKIRSKFRSLPRPSLSSRERQKESGAQDTPRFRLPERPKFNFPEKTKFSLPERPKFKLPDTAKFSLPERPKFHFPERPKLNLPERAKLHLPERTKIHLPERPKFHFPERPKFNLPERPKFNLPEMSKFHLPERPKLHLPERPKINLPHFVRPLRERQDASPRKNIFELDFKSYPKIFSKKARQRPEYTTSSPKKTRGITPPPKMRSDEPTAPQRKKVPVGQRWIKKMDDIKYADDDMSVEVKDSRRSDRSESFSDFRDKDLGGYMEDLDDSRFPPGGRKTLSTKSSMSHISDRDIESLASSEGKLRKGVLEEIDSDEFFLRQKGISQEDIDMGKYLSHEIREAFRSPEVNALVRMNYDYDEMEGENEPRKPTRTRSLKKHFESDPALSDNAGYKTYPPRRPNRKSRSQSKSLVNEEAIIAESGPMYENQYQEDNMSEYYKTPGPVKEYEHYKVPRPIADTMPVPYRRKKAAKKKFEDAIGTETSIEGFDEAPPQPLVRRKSKKRLDRKQESMEEDMSRREDEEKLREHECIAPEEAPVAPRRTRSLTRSLRSSRSFRSDVDESREVIEPEFMEAPVDTQSMTQVETGRPHHYEATDDDPGFGYATIGKPLVMRPERQKKEKPQRPPPPRRKKEITSMFHTVPRRTPVRPMRNYSTLGPSRPPRRSKFRSDDRLSQAYIEIESESAIKPLRYEECHGSNKDLQKEEVIEKMKGRPLPPPPRPPRQKSRGPDDLPEPEESEEAKISMALLKGEAVPVEVEALIHAPPADTAASHVDDVSTFEGMRTSPVEEVCVSTQTDPLPDDFLLDVEEDIIQEFSHEQLKLQQAFLDELKKETEAAGPSVRREQKQTYEEATPVQEKLERELLAQLEAEAERDEKEHKKELLEPFDVDQGYASLDRRQHKQEPETSTSSATFPQPIRVPVIPDIQTSVQVLRTDKLDVKELEVERLSVREVQAHGINVSNLHTNQLTADDVSTRSGNLSLGNIELPPTFIQQIVEKIPWEELRPAPSEAVLPSRRQLPFEGSEMTPPARRHRRHRRASSSSEEDRREDGRPHRSRHTGRSHPQSVMELSKQLATACAASGVRAVQSIASRMQTTQLGDKTILMRVILCVLALLIAGFLLLGCERQTVLHHHWDFQFPPQPPPHQF